MLDIDDPTVDACTSHSCARSVLTCFLVSPLFVPFPCCCFSLLLSVHTYVPCHYVFFVPTIPPYPFIDSAAIRSLPRLGLAA